GKVEKAVRAPTVALAEACDELLGTGGLLGRLVSLIEALAQREPVARAAEVSGPQRPVCRWLPAGQTPTVGESSARGAGPVNRFEFLVSTFGVGAGSFVGSAAPAETFRLGPGDVVSWQGIVSRLYELDAQYGGGVVYDLALQARRQLRRMLHRASYGPSTGEALNVVLGELNSAAGWLAFDSGRQAEARHWWLEASHTARLIGDDRLFVDAASLLSRQAAELGQPREAIDLAEAAQLAAKPWGTPRLRSHLLSLEAFATSRADDQRATWDALHEAEALLDSGPHDDDPSWLSFWDEADFRCCETRAALTLGQLSLAEHSSRTALALVRPEYSRNRVSYLTIHAEVLVKQRKIDEAVSTAAQAVEDASDISSARIDARLSQMRAELARYSDQPKVAEFLDWSGQMMGAKANGSVV
ncbi:MAG: hypothetical protein ACRDTC_08040, partial [Pseudonocardiaceae bacterium]